METPCTFVSRHTRTVALTWIVNPGDDCGDGLFTCCDDLYEPKELSCGCCDDFCEQRER